MRTRSKQLNIRLSEKEYQSLHRNAARCGLTVTAYVRMLLQSVRPKESPPLAYQQLTQALYQGLQQLEQNDTEGRRQIMDTLLLLQQALTVPEEKEWQ